MSILSVCGVAFCVVVLSKVLEKTSKEYSVIVSIVACVAILYYLICQLTPVLDFINLLTNSLTSADDIYTLLLKALGICIVTNLAVDVCKDAHENALSSVVLMGGKLCILILSIPLLNEVLSIVKQLIYGS